MARKLAYLPLYVRDFVSDHKVGMMTFLEQAFYLRLLMASWQAGGPLPDDIDRLYLLVGGKQFDYEKPGENGKKMMQYVLEACWEHVGSTWVSPRLERERAYAIEIGEARSEKAAAAARARWHGARSDAQAMPEQCSAMPSQAQVQVQAQEQVQENGIPPSGRYSGAERPRKRVRRTQAPIRIDGSETPLTPQAEVIEHWEKVWLLSRGSPWSHSPRDFILAAQALKLANGDLEAVKARVSMLLSQGEDAWVAQNASLELLVKRWNQLAVRVLPLAPEIRDVRSKQADIDAAFARIHARNGNGDAGTPRLPPALGGPPAVAGD